MPSCRYLGWESCCFYWQGFLLHPLLNIIHWLASGGWATVTVGSWPLLCGAVYYLLLLLLFGSSDWDDFTACERRLLIGAAVCCWGSGFYDKFRPQPLTVHFIDVGQGDAALVVTPQRQTLLIDTGGLRGDYDEGQPYRSALSALPGDSQSGYAAFKPRTPRPCRRSGRSS